ncbi:glycosyltransferase family 2 protein [Roseivivax sediminis]|uniref:Glycosyl transferase family 2 n=1 Tax=Roseivivax sediminis TaxID=936889 RepID=A0A1I1YH25_9RHOB|nr:glycosyltransferase family 2 protein [Roseivivax sediminis]SFE18328.1 Glycosyl transferase family 2 [Roseivivax sediminis]
MRIHLLVGPSERAAARLRGLLKDKAGALARLRIGAPDWNPIRLYLACSEPDISSILRFARGYRSVGAQTRLLAELESQIDALGHIGIDTLVIVSGHLGRLMPRPEELRRLRVLLSRLSGDIRITAHVEEQSRHLARLYPGRVAEGRITPLAAELALARDPGPWWDGALSRWPDARPYLARYPMLEAPAHWLDYEALVAHWEDTFGAGSMTLRPLDLGRLASGDAPQVLAEALSLDTRLGPAEPMALGAPPSAATTTRLRRFNEVLLAWQARRGLHCPRDLRRRFAREIAVDGPALDPGALSAVSERFAAANARLEARFPALAGHLSPPAPAKPWAEADPLFGYRATQYLTAFGPALERNGKSIPEMKAADRAEDEAASRAAPTEGLTDTAREVLPPLARMHVQKLKGSPYAPHNRLGRVNEEELAAPYPPTPKRVLPEGTSGRVIVGCMKNEGPYIVEWVAYHRAIGIDHFLIYTNGCDDGTDAILSRLQTMGVVQHRSNDNWTGNSPQQHALNRALTEPVIRDAEWIIHIDVDEFINVRCGDGTLDAFLARVPEATNVAMTWRLFGHDGVARLSDRFVIDQFEACAPAFCPKPHTAWGYKTMSRNIGAYQKISCHRPNKLAPGFEDRVRWVNGSGADITRAAARNGWRSSKGTIGYDLLQLNHYALRSAESFLIKRQRGRALHVDRSIGLNYWIRMDWSGARDITIKRNLPRLRAEYDRLMADPELARLHADALAWHRAKAEELHATPEFEDLYTRALSLRLTETERVAYALALDTES